MNVHDEDDFVFVYSMFPGGINSVFVVARMPPTAAEGTGQC